LAQTFCCSAFAAWAAVARSSIVSD